MVGVAEPENPHTAPEYEAKRQHDAYETALGVRLIWATKRCVEMVGVFGVGGLRQRVLVGQPSLISMVTQLTKQVYKQYSNTPCWELYRAMHSDFSVSRNIFPGAPAGLLANYIDRRFIPRWFLNEEKSILGRWLVRRGYRLMC